MNKVEKLDKIFKEKLESIPSFFDHLFFNVESRFSTTRYLTNFFECVFDEGLYENIGKKVNMYKVENQINIYHLSYQEYLELYQYTENKILSIYDNRLLNTKSKVSKNSENLLNKEEVKQSLQKNCYLSCIENQLMTIGNNRKLLNGELKKFLQNEQASIQELFDSIFKKISQSGQDAKEIKKSLNQWHEILKENKFYSSKLFSKNFEDYTKNLNKEINRSLIDDLMSKKIFMNHLFPLSILTKSLNMIEKNIHYTTSHMLTNIFNASMEMIEGKTNLNDKDFYSTEVGQFMSDFMKKTYSNKNLYELSNLRINHFKWLKEQLQKFNVNLDELLLTKLPIDIVFKKLSLKSKQSLKIDFEELMKDMESLKKEIQEEKAKQLKEFENSKAKSNIASSLIEIIMLDESSSFSFKIPDKLQEKKQTIEQRRTSFYDKVILELEHGNIYKIFHDLPKKTIKDFIYINNYFYYLESGVNATKNPISVETNLNKYKIMANDVQQIQSITLDFLFGIEQENRLYFYDLVQNKVQKSLTRTKSISSQHYWFSLDFFLTQFKNILSQDISINYTLQEAEQKMYNQQKKIKKI